MNFAVRIIPLAEASRLFRFVNLILIVLLIDEESPDHGNRIHEFFIHFQTAAQCKNAEHGFVELSGRKRFSPITNDVLNEMVGPVAEGVLVLFFFLREFLGEKRNENFDQEIPLYRIGFALKEVANVFPDAGDFEKRIGIGRVYQIQPFFGLMEQIDEKLRLKDRPSLNFRDGAHEVNLNAMEFSGIIPELKPEVVPFARQFKNSTQSPFPDLLLKCVSGRKMPADFEWRHDGVQFIKTRGMQAFPEACAMGRFVLQHGQEALELRLEDMGLKTVVDHQHW